MGHLGIRHLAAYTNESVDKQTNKQTPHFHRAKKGAKTYRHIILIWNRRLKCPLMVND